MTSTDLIRRLVPSSRAAAIEPTLIRRVVDQARPTSLHLGLGQPDLPVHEAVLEALAEFVASGFAPYSPNLGLAVTREAIAAHYGVDPAEVMVTVGVQEAMAVALLGLVEPGDEVLVPEPGFPAYANLVRAAGATPVPYRLDGAQGWRLDPLAVADATSEATRAIVINTPSNPTGAVHDRDDLLAVLELCAEREIAWISDEIYEDFVYDGAEHASPADFPAYRDAGVRLSGLSKSHAMMGWRIGWLTGPAELVEGLKPLHQHLVTSAATPAQFATVAALAHHDEQVARMRQIFGERRSIALDTCRELPGVRFAEPQGAFYLFLDAREHLQGRGLDSLGLALDILEQVDVVTIPGAGFGAGGEGHLRLAYTLGGDILSEALGRLKRYFEAR